MTMPENRISSRRSPLPALMFPPARVTRPVQVTRIPRCQATGPAAGASSPAVPPGATEPYACCAVDHR
jgi:hypothetical protein